MKLFRNIVSIIAGVSIGMAVNMGLIVYGSGIIPPPEGVAPMNADSISENLHLFEIQHFITPFLAHAIGTFVGAITTSWISASYHFRCSLIIGAFFLIGGIVASFMIPAPMWFIVLDLMVAYLPMGWLGWKLSWKEK